MSLKETLVRLAAFKLISERADVLTTAEKKILKDEVGGRMGATAAMLPDGTEAATVWITKPTKHPAKKGGIPEVSNPALFLEWVKTVDPSAIVESVRSTDVPRLLGQAQRALEETGEMPPGIELSEPQEAYESGGGVVAVKMSEEQKANMLRALISGAVALPSFVGEIEAGDDDDDT